MARVSKAIMVGDVGDFNDGKVLILKRAKSHITKDSPWEWDLPGGHIEEGDIPSWFMLADYTRFFVIQDWDGTFKLSGEHEDYEWIYPQEVTNYNIGKMYTNAVTQAFRKEEL